MSPAPRAARQRGWWWALMGAAAVVVVILGASAPPTSGTSDDRLFALAAQLKCQQCVGESVAGSQSPSAVKFREEIASQMATGATDDEILGFFTQRYGPEVLLTPPATGFGALVWVVPVVAVAGAALLLTSTFRRWRSERPSRSVTEEDLERVARARRTRDIS